MDGDIYGDKQDWKKSRFGRGEINVPVEEHRFGGETKINVHFEVHRRCQKGVKQTLGCGAGAPRTLSAFPYFQPLFVVV